MSTNYEPGKKIINFEQLAEAKKAKKEASHKLTHQHFEGDETHEGVEKLLYTIIDDIKLWERENGQAPQE